MWWDDCCGFCGHEPEEPDREPLLALYADETTMQRRLHQKLHTYQMLRALSQGYMPSNEQAIINLRTILTADVLNPENEEVSDAGLALTHYSKQWLKQFIDMLQHKNGENQLQDFLWYLSKARISVDTADLANVAVKSKVSADTKAAYQSLRTVGSLLLTNSDFRIFLSDLGTVAKEVLQDTAFTLSAVSKEVGKQLEPSPAEEQQLKAPEGPAKHEPVSQDTLTAEAAEVGEVIADGAGQVVQGLQESIVQKATGDEKDTLLYRLKKTVTNLRHRTDYSESVSTLSMLLRRYAFAYVNIGKNVAETLDQDIHTNAETDRALSNFWLFLTSFGDPKQWDQLEANAKALYTKGQDDPEFDAFIKGAGNLIQDMLLDPEFFENADSRFQKLRERFRQVAAESSWKDEVESLLDSLNGTLVSVVNDKDVSKLLETSKKLTQIISPTNQAINRTLLTDAINVFVPRIIDAIQYLPIPRLEIATPEIDLLLENLIIEPGKTVNNSSFFPYKLKVDTFNSLEIRKALTRTTSSVESRVTIKIAGISLKAEDIGFWLRVHSGLAQFEDEGIASFAMDEQGMDVELDVEIARERLEQMVTLHDVRVRIHKLTYALRSSRFSLMAWLFKPMMQPILRKTMEAQIATAIKDSLHFLNRELVYARERLRATRIANPNDLATFVRAVAARLVPEDDPDLYTRIGVDEPGRGVFKGRYAPGSMAKIWHEQGVQAAQRTREYEREGWRNDIFEVVAVPAMEVQQ